jgi:hypothetical protein
LSYLRRDRLRVSPSVSCFFLSKFRANCPGFNIGGEIALMSREPDAAKAEAYVERALAVARQQQAKSCELRTSMSVARLRRDQRKVIEARELLAPVYGWFTEGFDTRDLKEAKALLEAWRRGRLRSQTGWESSGGHSILDIVLCLAPELRCFETTPVEKRDN